MRLIKTRYQRVDHVEFGVTGGLLARGTKQAVYWPTPMGDETVQISSHRPRGATFVAGGEHIAYCDMSGAHLYRLADGERTLVPIDGDRGDTFAALGGTAFLLHGYFSNLFAFELTEDGQPRPIWTAPRLGFASRPIRASEEEVIQFRTDGSLIVRSVTTGQEVRTVMTGLQMSVFTSSAIAPGFRWLACTLDNQVRVFDPTTPDIRPVHRLDNSDGRHFTGLAFHPSGRWMAATSNDETVKLYDTGNWALATTFTWDIGRMRSVAFSPDGLLAAAGSDSGRVVVWDVDV